MRDMRPEADGRDLAGLEPAGGLDRVLVDQVLANGVGLFLGEDLGQVAVPHVVGVGGDHDLRGRLAGILAPAGDLVQAGLARRRQDRAAGFEQVVGGKRPAVARRAGLEDGALAVGIGPALEIARERPGLFQGGQVVFERGQGSFAPVRQLGQVLMERVVADELAEASFAVA